MTFLKISKPSKKLLLKVVNLENLQPEGVVSSYEGFWRFLKISLKIKKILKLLFQLSWNWLFWCFEYPNSPFTSRIYPFLTSISHRKIFLLKTFKKIVLYTFKKNSSLKVANFEILQKSSTWRLYTLENLQKPSTWRLYAWENLQKPLTWRFQPSTGLYCNYSAIS